MFGGSGVLAHETQWRPSSESKRVIQLFNLEMFSKGTTSSRMHNTGEKVKNNLMLCGHKDVLLGLICF